MIDIKYSPSIPDRSGSQVHDDLFAHAYCFNNGFEYGGSSNPNGLELRVNLSNLLSIPTPSYDYIPNLPNEEYRLDLLGINADEIFTEKFLNYVRSKAKVCQLDKKKTIALHVRRGDVDSNGIWTEQRYLSPEYYISILDTLQLYFPDHQLIIHSEYNFSEEIELFKKFNPIVKLDTDLVECWEDLITSEVYIMSKSSFSYVPALFNNGIILYTPFWHTPLKNWINVGEEDWKDKLHQIVS
jgi:hypothetical protein